MALKKKKKKQRWKKKKTNPLLSKIHVHHVNFNTP